MKKANNLYNNQVEAVKDEVAHLKQQQEGLIAFQINVRNPNSSLQLELLVSLLKLTKDYAAYRSEIVIDAGVC